MSEALPAAKETPSEALAKRVLAALNAAGAKPIIPDEFAERLVVGNVTSEDWRRMAERSLDAETRANQERRNV